MSLSKQSRLGLGEGICKREEVNSAIIDYFLMKVIPDL